MKLKLSNKKEKITEVVEMLLIGAGVLGLLAFIGKKLFAPVAPFIEKSGKQIDSGTEGIAKAIEKDKSIPEQQKSSIIEQIKAAKVDLKTKIEELQKKAVKFKDATNLKQKPSEILTSYLTEYKEKVKQIIQSTDVDDATQQEILQNEKMLEQATNTFKNIDKIMLIFNKQAKGSLWNSVKELQDVEKLQDEENWKKFTEDLVAAIPVKSQA